MNDTRERKKDNRIIYLAIIVVLGILGVLLILKGDFSGTVVGDPDCPFECCPEGEYSVKTCRSFYECIDNKCVALDTDNDGLTDLEEKELRTNLNNPDSDFDGLSDYKEAKVLGTDPIDDNTDNDRYRDGDDPDPKNRNSAIVDVSVSNIEWQWSPLGILDILSGKEGYIATALCDVKILNRGNDYTEYVNFDVVFELVGNEVKRVEESIGRLDENQMLTKHYEYKFNLAEIPNTLWNMITKQSSDWTIEIQNVRYKKF